MLLRPLLFVKGFDFVILILGCVLTRGVFIEIIFRYDNVFLTENTSCRSTDRPYAPTTRVHSSSVFTLHTEP